MSDPVTAVVVDDEPAAREVIVTLLADHPRVRIVGEATNGREALAILRDDPTTSHIPVIALTANAMPSAIDAGLAAGFFRYLTKPIDVDALIGAVDEALRESRGRGNG